MEFVAGVMPGKSGRGALQWPHLAQIPERVGMGSASRSALAAIVPTTPVRRQSAGCAYNSIEKPPQ